MDSKIAMNFMYLRFVISLHIQRQALQAELAKTINNVTASKSGVFDMSDLLDALLKAGWQEPCMCLKCQLLRIAEKAMKS